MALMARGVAATLAGHLAWGRVGAMVLSASHRLRVAALPTVLALALAACGPSVSVTRLSAAPARARTCELEFRTFEMSEIAPGGPYEVLGHVALSQEGVQDPLKEEYRAEVRPRACELGGEAVGILGQATATPWALSAGGTAVDYVVVRKRPAKKASAPTKF